VFKQSFTNIKIKNTTNDEIEKNYQKKKKKKSCGYYEITTKIKKISSPFYCITPNTHTHTHTHTHIYVKECFQLEHFQDRLKFSEIKPTYNKGDKTLITNYRPISLLPVFSKIFVKIIYRRIYHHLTSNNILVKRQFGFRCNNSNKIAIYIYIYIYIYTYIYVN
jgi:hypothetical protein